MEAEKKEKHLIWMNIWQKKSQNIKSFYLYILELQLLSWPCLCASSLFYKFYTFMIISIEKNDQHCKKFKIIRNWNNLDQRL